MEVEVKLQVLLLLLLLLLLLIFIVVDFNPNKPNPVSNSLPASWRFAKIQKMLFLLK